MSKRTAGLFVFCLFLIILSGYSAMTYITLTQPIPQAMCLFGTFASGLWAATIAYDLILGDL